MRRRGAHFRGRIRCGGDGVDDRVHHLRRHSGTRQRRRGPVGGGACRLHSAPQRCWAPLMRAAAAASSCQPASQPSQPASRCRCCFHPCSGPATASCHPPGIPISRYRRCRRQPGPRTRAPPGCAAPSAAPLAPASRGAGCPRGRRLHQSLSARSGALQRQRWRAGMRG